MKAVEHNPQVVAIGGAHDVPGLGPVLHPPPPGERLVADPHALLAGDIGEFRKVAGGALAIVDRIGGNVGAQAQEARAELMHEIELSRRAVEILRSKGVGHRLEVAQRLEGDDLKPEIGGKNASVARLAAEESQIVLEDLDGAKARLCGGGEFLLQRAAHADRGDRPSEHRRNPDLLAADFLLFPASLQGARKACGFEDSLPLASGTLAPAHPARRPSERRADSARSRPNAIHR